MERGKITILFLDRRFGFIQKENGQKVHFRLQAVDRSVRWENLREGMEVTFNIEIGEKGPTAVQVRLASGAPATPQTGQAKGAGGQAQPKSGPFLNPYNFARYMNKPSQLAGLGEAELRMWRSAPPAHDAPSGLSGKISCTLTAVTPLFVSGGRPPGDGHARLDFFKIAGEKVIPASGLRGPVRSVFEAVTNSCFAMLSNKLLSYRLKPELAGFLVPARVEKTKGAWGLRLLTGTAALSTTKKPNPLYPGPVRQYRAMNPSGKRPPSPTPPPLVSLGALGGSSSAHPSEHHRKECWAALVQGRFPPAWRVLAVAPDRAGAAAALARLSPRLPHGVVTMVSQGYLCVTNQNIDNKASERFFFDDPKSGPKVIALPEDVRMKYSDLIADYQERHADEVKERRRKGHDPRCPVPGSKDEPGFSRFVLERSERYLRDGDLVYAMLRGTWPNVQVEFIAPVSIPRVAYERGAADLLPQHLRRCDSYDALCPACRTFGWVKGEQGRNERSAYRGRVRFSDARRTKPVPLSAMTLAILGSPKPTTARFYLVGPDGKPKNGRSDQEAGYDGNDGKNRLRGRKVYRTFRPNERSTRKEADRQNCTIQDPEGAGAQFKFDVRFEDLQPEELGALLWSLTLGGAALHKMGMGKPLGLGSAEIKVDALRIEDLDTRYTTPDKLGAGEPEQTGEYIARFQEAITRLYRPKEASMPGADFAALFHQLEPVADLLALLGKKEPALPVHYPYSPDPDSKGSFEWFVGNNRGDGPRLELGLAAEDQGLPLLDKRGKQH